MFNEAMKNLFIEETYSNHHTTDYCRRTFELIQKYEEQNKRDICTFNAEELSTVISEIIGLRERSKAGRMIILQKYIDWCVKRGYPGAKNELQHVDTSNIDKIKSKLIANPKQLQNYLDSYLADEHLHTADNLYRAYLWIGYGGIPERYITQMNSSHIHLDTMEIVYENYTAPIYREAIVSIKDAATAETFEYIHPRYTISRNRLPGDYLFRSVRGTLSGDDLQSQLSKKVSAYRKKYPDSTIPRLYYYNVWLSGIFYRMYETEAAGFEVDFTQVVNEFMSGKEYKFTPTATEEYKIRQLKKEFSTDYERWKAAFIK